MRYRLFWALAIFATVPLTAGSLHYSITFQYGGGVLARQNINPDPTKPSAGSFDYDPSTQTFTNFLVSWQNGVYDFAALASHPSTLGYFPFATSSCGWDFTSGSGILGALLDGHKSSQCFTGWTAAAVTNPLDTSTRTWVLALNFCDTSTYSACSLSTLADFQQWAVLPGNGLYANASSGGGTANISFYVGPLVVAEAPVTEQTPEASTLGLLGIGLMALAGARRLL